MSKVPLIASVKAVVIFCNIFDIFSIETLIPVVYLYFELKVLQCFLISVGFEVTIHNLKIVWI